MVKKIQMLSGFPKNESSWVWTPKFVYLHPKVAVRSAYTQVECEIYKHISLGVRI